MSNIVFKGKDGSVAIMTLAPGANEADAIRKFHECHPDMYDLKHLKDISIPVNRQDRDKWTLKNSKIVVS